MIPVSDIMRRCRNAAGEHHGSALALIFLLLVYAPAFERNMLWFDDWGGVQNVAGGQSLWASIRAWFPLMGYRPIGGAFLGTVNWLFLSHHTAMFVINIVLFLAGNVLLGIVLSRIFGPRFLVPWLLLSGLPIAAEAEIYSPVNMLCYNLVAFVWAAVACAIVAHRYSRRWLGLAALTCFMVLLTYDLVFPVIIVVSFCLFLADSDSRLTDRMRRWSPVLVSVCLASAYQKLLAPALSGLNLSRLDLRSVVNPARWVSTAAQVFTAEFHAYSAGVKSPHDIPLAAWLLAGMAIVATCTAIMRSPRGEPAATRPVRLTLIAVSLVASTLPYILSDYHPHPFGYDSRVLAPSWCLLALATAGALAALRSAWRAIVLCGLLVPLVTGAAVQRNEFIRAATERLNVLRTVQGISDLLPAGATLVMHVPLSLPGSRFGVTVVSPPWESGGLFAEATKGRLLGVTIDAQRISQNRAMVSGDSLVVDNWWSVNLPDKQVYFFDPERGLLCHVQDAETMKRIFAELLSAAADRTEFHQAKPAGNQQAVMHRPISAQACTG